MFEYKLLKKLYDKSVIFFTILWIVLYCVLFSLGDYLSSLIGIDKLITAIIGLLLSSILLDFLRKYNLFDYYGLKKSNTSLKTMLFYIPLIILISVNLWNGVKLNYDIGETILFVVSMIFVGLLEEIIFRGLLFNEMKKDGLSLAIIISSLTFGIGHIINLFNGSEVDLLSNILQVIYATSAGFMFVMIYLQTDSLIICIISHILFNSLSAFSIEYASVENEIITSIIISLLTLSYGMYLLFQYNKKTKNTTK